MKFIKSFLVIFFVLPVYLLAQTENIDQAVMAKIRNEGLHDSKVMDIAFHLTELNGPRVTNSPGFMRAAHYAKDQLSQWGLVNSKVDPWGDFGKGWELKKSYIAMLSPWYRPLIAYPKTWTSGTKGPQTGAVVLISAKTPADLDAYRGKLHGKILIFDNLIRFQQGDSPDAGRLTDAELQTLSDSKEIEDSTGIRKRREKYKQQMSISREMLLAIKKLAEKEGAIAILTSDQEDYGGTILVLQGGPYKISDRANFLDMAIGLEDYNMIVRLLRNKTAVKMTVDVKTKFELTDTKGYNVFADIPGVDDNFKDQIVMLGAHLDSWPAADGATDDAAGVCVMMEAVRILKDIGIRPKRTIRIALWSGEEQGLFGSRAYVKKTYGDPETMKLLPAHDKFSVYFNLDNGPGKILGIHLQGNEAARNIFKQWFAPFNDLGAKAITIRNTGSTDHISFDAVGLPGFQFIQDRLQSQHSNMDSYDHLVPDDLKQSATIVAALVYDAAMRDQEFPRKPLPEPSSVDPITGSYRQPSSGHQ